MALNPAITPPNGVIKKGLVMWNVLIILLKKFYILLDNFS